MADTKLSAEQEELFNLWYTFVAQEKGLNLDPDDPLHYYDYRGLFDALQKGETKMIGSHFPSKWKREGHPNLIVDGVNTKTGRRVD